jgi:hypothetical protein
MKIKLITISILILFIMITASCAAGANQNINSPNKEGNVAGFWQGLWHGIIAPVTFVISLFSENVSIYEVYNNGGWYNLGFLLGLIIIFGGGSGGAVRRRKVRIKADD